MKLKKLSKDIKTIFGLIGTDEKGLTSSLGYLYAANTVFLLKTLKRLGLKGIWESTIKKSEIRLQHYEREHGITDIEIELKGYFKIIIEAKIGLSIPTFEQCKKYISRLDSESNNFLVILQNPNYNKSISEYINIEPKFKKVLKGLYWHEILEDAIDLLNKYQINSLDWYLLKSFIDFAREEYYMKSYTDEIWIVPASNEPLWKGGLSHFDIHTKIGKIYYRKDKPNYWPLYMAFRKDGFGAIQKVQNIVYFDKLPIDYVPDLKNVEDKWPKEPHVIWELSDPIPLGKHIATGSGMYNRHVLCTFKDLFLYSSVADIEKNRSV